ncbi:hypothetical protein B0H14DRAFT_2631809 [Mycena olivaceomarginata]|nr:hypothetical protein B0H14DRAFT_2631809 [Mycena olivaceomarginata]
MAIVFAELCVGWPLDPCANYALEQLQYCSTSTKLDFFYSPNYIRATQGSREIDLSLPQVLCRTALPVGVIVGVSTIVTIVFIGGLAASFVLRRRRQRRRHGTDPEYVIVPPFAGLEADIGWHGSFERGNPTEYMQASEGEWEISALRAQVAHLEDQIPETPFLDPPPEWTA